MSQEAFPVNQETLPVNDDLVATHDRAMQAYHRGEMHVAEQGFKRIAEAIPRDAEGWFYLGNVYASTSRPMQALQAYTEALVRKPDMVKAWHNRGVVYMREATASFLEVQRLTKPDDPLHTYSTRLATSLVEMLGKQPPKMIPNKPPDTAQGAADNGVVDIPAAPSAVEGGVP